MVIRLLTSVALMLALGIATAERVAHLHVEHVFATALAIALGGLIIALRRRSGTVLAAWSVAFAVGGFAVCTGPPLPEEVTTCGHTRDATGRVFGRYRVRIDGPGEWIVRDWGKAHMRVPVELEAERCSGQWRPRDGRAVVSLWEGPHVVRGDSIVLDLAVEPVSTPHNPTDRDPRIQALLDDTTWRAAVGSPHLVVGRGTGVIAKAFAFIDEARRAARTTFDARLPRATAAIAKGLVMGDRGGMTALERDAWADAGIAHLLAVSGMHVTLIVVVAVALARYAAGGMGMLCDGFGERVSLRAVGAAVALPCAGWFCLWSASPASAVRATVMGGVVLVGRMFGLESSALAALMVTIVAMLTLSPALLHDAGFGLSVVAVGALLVLPTPREGTWLGRQVRVALASSTAATLATLPITATCFGRIGVAAPLTNLLAVPLGALIATPVAIGAVLVEPLSAGLAGHLARLAGLCIEGLEVIVRYGGWAIDVAEPRPVQLAGYAAAVVAFYAAMKGVRIQHAIVAALGVVLMVAGRAMPDDGVLSIDFPYVGQGDAVFIRFPHGTTMLVDAGGNVRPADWEPGRNVVAPLLRSLGVRSIDYVVNTHPHPDHLGGLAYLAPRFPSRTLWRSGQHAEHPVLKLFGNAQSPASTVIDGVQVSVLHPVCEDCPGYFEEFGLNDNSVVLRLVYGERSILLTGDVESLAEESVSWPSAEIIKVPHHGSRTSSTVRMLDAVKPQIAVISRGEHNMFGFPHQEVIERYRGRNVRILDTAVDGAIRVTTNGLQPWEVTTCRRH